MEDDTVTVFQIDADQGLYPLDYERKRLAESGTELVEGSCLTADELIERGQNARVLWLAWKPGVDRAVLAAMPNVELVVRWGVGYDQIDIAAATELGVAVANAPDYGTVDVAEHVIALLMAGARRVAWYHEQMRGGAWPDAATDRHHRMMGRQLGILGMGRIGSAVAQRATGLGLKVVGYDPALDADTVSRRGAEPADLHDLLATSDYISIHMPLTAETRHFFDANTLGKVKRGAGLVNASRGKVVDMDALIAALADGTIAWAGLDVYEEEPLPADHPIRSVPEVVLTPHLAGYSIEAWQDLRAEMCLTTEQWLQTGWAERVVNPDVRPNLRRHR